MTGGSGGGGGSTPLHVTASGTRPAVKKTISFKDSQDEPGSSGDQEEEKKEGVVKQKLRKREENDGKKKTTESLEMETTTSDAQRQLHQYRQTLAQQLERSSIASATDERPGHPAVVAGPIRVSPIQEESPPTAGLIGSVPLPSASSASEPTTTSTESGNTIRGGMTPGLTAGTPSYPFPRMTSPGFMQTSVHRPFTTLSPTQPPVGPPGSTGAVRGTESIMSNPSTPASTVTFLPRGYSSRYGSEGPRDFPTPNLYDLTLMLSAEPGLDAWWNTVIQIMTEVYRAERVTLAIPADSTDIENVPWGQKATFNAHHEDGLSLGYLGRGSSYAQQSNDDFSEMFSQVEDQAQQAGPVRPGLSSRHSFTSYEDKKEKRATADRAPVLLNRPSLLSRSKTTHPVYSLDHHSDDDDEGARSLNRQALAEHDALEEGQNIPSWEAPITAKREGQGKILNVLQALDYEADPLIDHNGVVRVLERGKVIALTRSYPYLGQPGPNPKTTVARGASQGNPPEAQRKRIRKRSDSTSKLSSLLSSATLSPAGGRLPGTQATEKKASGISSRLEDEQPRPPTPKYEEYEQTSPSPWSQSPAPSPAVRADPAENPFFTDAMVDEESFNPSSAPQDYSTMRHPEAIGVDNSWTVLHIPLTHVLLSKPNPAFKLNTTLMEQKIYARGKIGDAPIMPTPGLEHGPKEKNAPIAILSILSPIIPYPSTLRTSLEHLAPHLATSFSLCRHYTNLETELNGLQKRRPQTAGFGALDPEGRPLADPAALANFGYLPTEDNISRGSFAGSITSPSDYSGPSRSAAGSPAGTPGWEPAGFGLIMDKRPSATSPAPMGGDSYFNTKPKSGSGSGGRRTRRNSKEDSMADRRSAVRLSGGKLQYKDAPHFTSELQASLESGMRSAEEVSSPGFQQRRTGTREQKDDHPLTIKEERSGGSLTIQPVENQRRSQAGPHTPHAKHHSQLHSYGADFASTFQSLPPSSIIGRGVPQAPVPSRAGSVSTTGSEMTPPSDKLKGLILDSLPAHVFVALPQTGEIVWVNSRFLTYRGQTSGDLAADPWGSIHPDDREDYLRAWSHSVRTGEQFSRTVRIRRFDGAYRWFYARAVASKDKRGVILQFLGSYMDIHDQHIAELRAARQEEIEASEAKHRLLANLIPQIIFTATEDEGITFANEQWLSYTGQSFEGVLGLGFMDYVHPEDLAKCRIPPGGGDPPTPPAKDEKEGSLGSSGSKFASSVSSGHRQAPSVSDNSTVRGSIPAALSRNNSSSSGSVSELSSANLTELARKGVIKVSTDSNGRLSYTTEIRLRSKSGEYRWHLVRCVEIDNVDFGNGASSYFGSATDINDLKLLETKLKEAMESKGRFLSNMSHEIRTPLIGISGMVSFLQDTTLNEEQRDYTNTIQTSANSLIMIINDILDLSKVDAGMMKLNHEWFHTRSLIEDVNELVSTMAIAKRLELNYVVEEDVPAWVKGDKVRIRQVLLNVIGNAIKFTSQGEVFSHCKVVSIPKGHDDDEENWEEGKGGEVMLEFSIIDTGRGFTKEEAELIFKPFSQIDGSSTRQHGGSGLGLVISRQLVELHGGKMEGTAVPGKGSTFTFTAKFGLPSEQDNPETERVSKEGKGLQGFQSGQPTPGMLQHHVARIASGDIQAANLSPPSRRSSEEVAARRQVSLPLSRDLEMSPRQSPSSTITTTNTTGFTTSPTVLSSSGSSEPSIHSMTDRSSISSGNNGLARFSEAARASGQDLAHMKLEMPPVHRGSNSTSPSGDRTATPGSGGDERQEPTYGGGSADKMPQRTDAQKEEAMHLRLPMYSILIICPQLHSREATTKHIEMTLPKDTPHQITALASVEEARKLISGDDSVNFTHVVVNLPSPEEIVDLMDEILRSGMVVGRGSTTSVVILSDSVQRQAVMKQVAGTKYQDMLSEQRVTYIYKPVKPSRFAVIFDPDKERDLSIDRNRSTAQRLVESQKQSYLEVEKRMGNKGYKVLLVEDNPVNQKVLEKYLRKVGVAVEVAADGVECTDTVFSRPRGYYSLILVGLLPPYIARDSLLTKTC